MHLPHRYYDLASKRMALSAAAATDAQMMAPLGMMTPNNPTSTAITLSMASGFPVTAGGTSGLSSITGTIVNVGDIVVLGAYNSATAMPISNVSLTGWTWTKIIAHNATGPNWDSELWYAVVPSGHTGSQAFAITWTNGASHNTGAVLFELVPSGGTTWTIAGTPSFNTTTSLTVTYPSVTAGSSGANAYIGNLATSGTVSAGSTSGFTYGQYSASGGNDGQYCYDLAVAASSSPSPTSPQTPSSLYCTVGAIIQRT